MTPAAIVVVHNPAARGANETRLRRVVATAFGERRVDYCTCLPDENMSGPLAPWLQAGVEMVIAAGGDGTISDVAAALVGKPVTLGILPLGTSNVLARELRLPLNAKKAAELLAGEHATMPMDVLRINGRVYVLGASIGLSASVMAETGSRQKKLLGTWAYWLPYARRFLDMRGGEFQLELDGTPMTVRASDLLAMNVGAIGFRTMRWGEDVRPDDGMLNLCYLQARTGINYLWVIMNFVLGRYIRNDRVNCLPVYDSVRFLAPENLVVQADGDIIGRTPIEIVLEKAALQVAVRPKK